jgi:hypothetical protein
MDRTNRERLLTDGYCVVENVLSPDTLATVRSLAGRPMIDAQRPDYRGNMDPQV